MATGLLWIEKLELLQDFVPIMVHSIRAKLEGEYFAEHPEFVMAFFPRYYKQHRLLRLGELCAGVLQATVGAAVDIHAVGSSEDDNAERDQFAQEFCTMWILEFVSIYELFEEGLKGIHEDFEQITQLDEEISRHLVNESIARFGPIETYIFAVLMSVLLEEGVFEALRKAAFEALQERSHQVDMNSTLEIRPESEKASLSRSDGLEMLKSAPDQQKRSPLSSPSKVIDSTERSYASPAVTSSRADLFVGSFPPRSDPALLLKAKARYLGDHNAKFEVINRRHSSQLYLGPSRSPFSTSSNSSSSSSSSSRIIRTRGSPIKMQTLLSSSVPSAATDIFPPLDSAENDVGVDGDSDNVINAYSRYHRDINDTEGNASLSSPSRMMLTSSLRDRLRISRETAISSQSGSIAPSSSSVASSAPSASASAALESVKSNDIYQKYLKQHRIEGFLSKQSRNPDKQDVKYRDKPWKRRWVVLSESSISYFEEVTSPEPRGCIPVHVISRVGTAPSYGPNTFYIEAGNRNFLFRCVSEAEMQQWLFGLQCAIAVNLEQIVDPKSRKRGEILSNVKKWWKRAATDWSPFLLQHDLESDDLLSDVDQQDITSSAPLPQPLIPSSRAEAIASAEFRVQVASCARQGCRDYMEDERLMLLSIPKVDQPLLVAAVFDGHGGAEAAQYCKFNFAEIFEQLYNDKSNNRKNGGKSEDKDEEKEEDKGESAVERVSRALRGSFPRLDEQFIRTSVRGDQSSGTTATVVLISATHIFAANVGDSRAILCRSGPESLPIELTVDHRPGLPQERARVLHAGGQVEEQKDIDLAGLFKLNPSLLHATKIPQRLAQMVGFVTTCRIYGCLCVSRAIGDAEFKGDRRVRMFGPPPLNAPKDLVIAEADMSIHERDDERDEFIVIATDGVWDVLSNIQVCEIVREELKRGVQPAIIAENLVTKALTQGSQDNITATVVVFNSIAPQGGALRRSRPGPALQVWKTASRG